MQKTSLRSLAVLSIVLLSLVIDQVIKFYIKTNYTLGEKHSWWGVDWANFYFVENKGMAFGLDIIGGTILLCCFRIVAIAFLFLFLFKLLRNRFNFGYLICIALITAGAMGNILDNIFYGVLFSESTYTHTAQLVPIGQGYSTWFVGKVVDMFYFPIIDTYWPSFFPIIGGEHFIFFSPIFNFADASISCGAIAIFLFFRKSLCQSFRMLENPKPSEHEES